MASFKVREDAFGAFLPGVGRVRPGQIFEGESWAAYCPDILVPVTSLNEEKGPRMITEQLPVARNVIVEAPPVAKPVPVKISGKKGKKR